MFMLFLLILVGTFVPAQSWAGFNFGNGAAEACWINQESHVDATACLMKMLELYQGKLKASEEKLVKEAEKSDAQEQPLHKYKVDSAGALKKSNAAFYAYMSAECDRVRAGYGAGTYGGDAYATCQINLIVERLDRLGELK